MPNVTQIRTRTRSKGWVASIQGLQQGFPLGDGSKGRMVVIKMTAKRSMQSDQHSVEFHIESHQVESVRMGGERVRVSRRCKGRAWAR
ncbi:MAG TPA: hypothetical protein DCZ95_17095 [Verrucomicrobia bacterium]|nr:hypothetical protein [Verrucomicrobiota bacterium]